MPKRSRLPFVGQSFKRIDRHCFRRQSPSLILLLLLLFLLPSDKVSYMSWSDKSNILNNLLPVRRTISQPYIYHVVQDTPNRQHNNDDLRRKHVHVSMLAWMAIKINMPPPPGVATCHTQGAVVSHECDQIVGLQGGRVRRQHSANQKNKKPNFCSILLSLV